MKTATLFSVIWCFLTLAHAFPISFLKTSKSTNLVEIGSSLVFRSLLDGSVITVLKDGIVVTEMPENLKLPKSTQIWKPVGHPTNAGFYELKQDLVPYNDLSGYEFPNDPDLFPRPLNFFQKSENQWHILIRNRFCLQANGPGRRLDIDDCESYFAPWQLWELIEIA